MALLVLSLLVRGQPCELPFVAAAGTDWSQPVPIAGWEASQESWFPHAVADSSGVVHAVFGTWVGGTKPSQWATNAIYYARLGAQGWSTPVDIMASPANGAEVWADDLAITKEGYLVMGWRSGVDVGVAWVPIAEAGNARSWMLRRIDMGQSAKVAIDRQSGTWYVAYDRDRKSISLSYSDDLGASWKPSRLIASTDASDKAVRLWGCYVAADRSIQLIWTEYAESRSWLGVAVWHARLADRDAKTVVVREAARSDGLQDPTLDAPVICAGKGSTLRLFWNNGVGSTTGRFHQVSSDNGLTWSPTSSIFPGLSGQTSQAACALDSAGDLHFVTAANGDGYGHAVTRYAVLRDAEWTTYDTLWGDTFPGEHPALTIALGNQLYLLWDHFDYGQNSKTPRIEVSQSQLAIDAPAQTPMATHIAPTATPAPTRHESTVGSTLTPRPSATSLTEHVAPIARKSSSTPAIIYGGLAALLVVIPTLLIAVTRHRRG